MFRILLIIYLVAIASKKIFPPFDFNHCFVVNHSENPSVSKILASHDTNIGEYLFSYQDMGQDVFLKICVDSQYVEQLLESISSQFDGNGILISEFPKKMECSYDIDLDQVYVISKDRLAFVVNNVIFVSILVVIVIKLAYF